MGDVSVYPKGAKPHSFEECCGIIQNVYDAGDASVLLGEGGSFPDYTQEAPEDAIDGEDPRNGLYIADLENDTKLKVLKVLLNRGDPDRSDPAFINAKEQKVENVSPPEGFAPGNSTHLFLYYGEEKAHHGKQRMILERSVGLSRTLIFSFLNFLLRKYAHENNFEYENKDKKMIAYRPLFKHANAISRSLKDDLKEGYVTSIELIDRQAEYAGPDKDKIISRVSRRMRIGVKKTQSESKILGLIESLRDMGKEHHYDEVQIHLGGLSGTTASPSFALEIEQAADMVYGRIETIGGFSTELLEGYAKLNDDICKGMLAKMFDDASWPG